MRFVDNKKNIEHHQSHPAFFEHSLLSGKAYTNTGICITDILNESGAGPNFAFSISQQNHKGMFPYKSLLLVNLEPAPNQNTTPLAAVQCFVAKNIIPFRKTNETSLIQCTLWCETSGKQMFL